jgi:hypothetical protein
MFWLVCLLTVSIAIAIYKNSQHKEVRFDDWVNNFLENK